jgi:hypothetical protein
MKKVKKYYPGVNGLVYDNSKSYGVLNPKPEDPNAFSTGKMLFPQQKTLGNIVDRKTFSSETLSKNAPSFMDKAGDFIKGGDIGGMASSLGGSIAMLINANKKQDPTGRPYKTGTKKLNTDMKRKKYDEGSDALLNIAGPRMTNTPGENFGYSLSTNSAKKSASVRQKPAMSAEMQKVARLQQKMKDAGYDIKVDGAWRGETQRIYDAYTKDKATNASRKGTVNTGQGPTIQNAQNLKEARAFGAKGPVLDQVNITAPAKKSYNQFDSPVLRGAANDTQARMKQEQAAANARARARQAEIAKNSQSLPSDNQANRNTFNAGNKGQGQDFTTSQDNALKQNRLVGEGATSKNSTRVKTFGLGTMAARLFGGNVSSAASKMPSKMPNKMGSSMLKKVPSTPFNPMDAIKPAMPVDNRPGMEAVRNYKPAMPKKVFPNMPKPMTAPTGPSMNIGKAIAKKTPMSSPKLQFVDGTKKVSGYSKLDTKLGGILPGGVTRAEAKAAKAAKNASPEGKFGPMAGGYAGATKATTGVGPLAGGYAKPAADASKPAGPMTDIRRYTNADNMPASSSTPATSAKKSLKSQYEENKGGYARALKGGKKDAQGNIVDPNTGLAYKQLPAKTGGAGKGGAKATTAPKESSLFKNGVAVKNFKDKNTGRTFYTNGRVFDEKTGKMAKYSHDAKANKVNLQWDKAKAAPKRKGDDTYIDEGIDIASRAVGSIGGGALGGFLTGGIGTAPGAIAGDYAGKRLGNYINKKLGYREEDDASQEGYSVSEGLMAGVGGGLLSKAVKPVGGALIRYGSKEASKVAAAPLGRAIAATGRAAGKLVGKGGSKAAAQTTSNAASQGASQAASQGAKQSVKLVNAPGAMSKVAPTAQSSRAAGNLGKVPTKAVRGQGGKFAKNSSNTPVNTTPRSAKMIPERPNRFNPDNAVIRPNGPTALDKIGRTPGTAKTSAQTATSSSAQGSAMGPAQANLRQSASNAGRTAVRKTKEAGKKAINFAKNNKKKTAVGAGAAGTVGAGIYAASKMRTSEG